jgi:hypothetical protein
VRIVLSRLPAMGADVSIPVVDRYSAKRLRPAYCRCSGRSDATAF